MLKYIKLTQFGKGTVTHEDWNKLFFVVQVVAGGYIASVSGEEKDIDIWTERNKALELDEKTALITLKEAAIAGLTAYKATLEVELSATTAEKTAKESELSDLNR